MAKGEREVDQQVYRATSDEKGMSRGDGESDVDNPVDGLHDARFSCANVQNRQVRSPDAVHGFT